MLTKQAFGPNTQTLTTLFKALIRNKIDYGIIAYGVTNLTNLAKIDIVCRGILRMILGAFRSTPVDILYTELGLEPIKRRFKWLMARYLIKLSNQPHNSTYQSANNITKTPQHGPLEAPRTSSQCSRKIPPPWTTTPHTTSYFSMSKTDSKDNQSKARAMITNDLRKIPPTSLIGFTDGSVTPVSASRSFIFPDNGLKGAWHLTPGSSIQTAELHGILKALEAIYHTEPGPPGLHIFTDSQQALLAINSTPRLPQNPVTLEIWSIIQNLKDAGTRTHLNWIPSHIGISGNEQADKLVNDQQHIPPSCNIQNPLTAPELIKSPGHPRLAPSPNQIYQHHTPQAQIWTQ
ncbi:uncharacterized protein LOC130688071 [Daphnia carinata]|uniref:uncharacterized protein LOC130688071 n=1 Tax=Daphnia carinata TaxID=120202 RepID=UPI00257ED666|nr:uncharacterized protein LOC130688071 [Daphnia carinata]